jgi:hypothetical protein
MRSCIKNNGKYLKDLPIDAAFFFFFKTETFFRPKFKQLWDKIKYRQ